MVRPATRADGPRIWALIHELAEYEHLTVTGEFAAFDRHAFDEDRLSLFVAEADELVVGYSISFPTYSTFRCRPGMWLEDIYVTPEYRGQGHGKALLTNLFDLCREQRYGRLEWSVLDWNEPSIRFYEAMGASVLPDWKICRVSF